MSFNTADDLAVLAFGSMAVTSAVFHFYTVYTLGCKEQEHELKPAVLLLPFRRVLVQTSWLIEDCFRKVVAAIVFVIAVLKPTFLWVWMTYLRRNNKNDANANKAARSLRLFQYLAYLINQFTTESGLEQELKIGLCCGLLRRLPINLILLQKVHAELFMDKESYARPAEEAQEAEANPLFPTMDMARRIMKFATSIYGNEIVAVAQTVDRTQEFSTSLKRSSSSLSLSSLESIEETLLDYNSQVRCTKDVIHSYWDVTPLEYCLSHAIVLDHANQQAVLVIRGTSSVLDIMIDAQYYTVPFCGGYAHAGFVAMAKGVYAKVEHILNDPNGPIPPTYELILTGHSSGGSVASLLTLYLLQNSPSKLRLRRGGVRCLAYAPTPSFGPLDAIDKDTLQRITSYITGDDALVAMLNCHSGRRLNFHVAAINEARKEMSWRTFLSVLFGWYHRLPDEFIQKIRKVDETYQQMSTMTNTMDSHSFAGKHKEAWSMEPVRGVPLQWHPCSNVVWMNRTQNKTKDGVGSRGSNSSAGGYSYMVCDPERLRQRGMVFTFVALLDHVPVAYEAALLALSGTSR